MKTVYKTIQDAMMNARKKLVVETDRFITNEEVIEAFKNELPERYHEVLNPTLEIFDKRKKDGRTTINSYFKNKDFKIKYNVPVSRLVLVPYLDSTTDIEAVAVYIQQHTK